MLWHLGFASVGLLLCVSQPYAQPADPSAPEPVPQVQYDYRDEVGEKYSVYQIDIRGRVVSETHNLTGLANLSILPSQTSADANQVAAPYATQGEWSTYDLDGRGNWVELTTAKTAYGNSLGVADAYTSFAGQSLSYDARGSLATIGPESYSWDSFGELRRLKDGADSHEFVRDALGRVVGERDAGGDETWYNYDGVHKAVRYQPGAGTDYTVGGQGVDEHYLRLGQSSQDPTYYYLGGARYECLRRGLAKVEQHIAQFGDVPQNKAMVGRLRAALNEGQPISGADASFYMHEVSEATMMARGASYPAAHVGLR